jgi:hypothetical protein
MSEKIRFTDIDREIAEEEPCPTCPECDGYMKYRADWSDGYYRPFAICENCGYESDL